MSNACLQFRKRWLEELAATGGCSGPEERPAERHPQACEACAAWFRRLRVQVGIVTTLERLLTPAELDERVAVEAREAARARVREREEAGLSEPQARAAQAVRELPRRPVPEALDGEVFGRIPAWIEESPTVRAIRTLERFSSPAVLDRLVAEELADLDKAQTRRLVGSLGRLSTPATLDQRVLHGRQGGLVRRARSWGVGLCAAAAAVVLVGVWGPWSSGRSVPAEVGYPFEVVEAAADSSELHPLALGLQAALSPLSAIDPTQEGSRVDQASLRKLLETAAGSEGETEDGKTETRGGAPLPSAADPGAGSGSIQDPLLGQEGVATGSDETASGGIVGLNLENPLESVAHSGMRTLSFFDGGQPTPRYLAYEDRIVTDGEGNFSLTPLRAMTPVQPDEQTFLFLMQNREGFIFRYRDLRVRDYALFKRNYTIKVRPKTLTVAGRACREFDIRSLRDGSRALVARDVETGLFLRCNQYDENGQPVAWMEYQTFTLDPNTSGVVFHQPVNEEVPLNVHGNLRQQLGFNLRVPKLTPPGFELHEAATVADPGTGRPWVKLLYTDGLQTLFFLQPVPASAGGTTGTVGKLRRGREGDKVVLHQLGPILSGHARLERYEFIVTGPVSQPEIIDMITSAVP